MKPADMYMEDLWDFFSTLHRLSEANGPGINKVLLFIFRPAAMVIIRVGCSQWFLKMEIQDQWNHPFQSCTIWWNCIFSAVGIRICTRLMAQTGKEIWKFKTREQPVYHVLERYTVFPCHSDGVLYFGARDGFFDALKAGTGDSLWSFSADNSWVLTTAAIMDSTVFFGTSDSYLLYAS